MPASNICGNCILQKLRSCQSQIKKQQHMKSNIFYILFSLLFLNAKAQGWTVYNTTNSLLPDNHIQAITIQKNGVKWIGTANGLARFDGRNWTSYHSTINGLPSSNITALAAGKMNDIWIGT